MNKKSLSLVIILLMCLTLFANGNQMDTKASNATPTVNKGSKLLRVTVLNGDDEHINGLKKEQFKLSINGKDQPISSVKEINLLTGNEDSKQYNQNLLKEDPIYHVIMIANVPQDARLIDKMKEGLLDFLSENENSGAPIGIFILTPDGIMKLADMSTDIKALNTEVINAFSKNMFCNEMSFEMEDAKFAMINHLTDFALSLGNIPGSKDLIILSAGIPDTFPERETPKGVRYIDQLRLEAEKRKEFMDSLKGFSGLLSKSNIKIDFVDLSKAAKYNPPNPGFGLAESSKSIATSSSGDLNYYTALVKFYSELKLRIARGLASAGGGEMFENGLSSSGQLTDDLNQILYNNAQYYIVEFIPIATANSDEKIVALNLEVKNDDAEKVIYNKNLLLE